MVADGIRTGYTVRVDSRHSAAGLNVAILVALGALLNNTALNDVALETGAVLALLDGAAGDGDLGGRHIEG